MDISKQSGHTDFTWTVGLNRFGLRLVGLWPQIGEDSRSSVGSDLRISIVIVIITFLSGIPFVSALIRVWGDLILMIDNLGITLTFLTVLLQLVIMRWKRPAVSSLLEMILEDWMELKLDKERQIMMKQAQIGRLIMICGYCSLAFGFIAIIVLSSLGFPYRHPTNMTDGERMLPLQAYYFYDTNKSPQFELTFVVQSASLFVAAIAYTSVDTFLGLCVLHMCGQLEIFRLRIAKWVLNENFDAALYKNVQMHRRLIRFAGNIEDAFSLLTLGLVLHFIIAFCLYAFLFLAVVTADGTDSIYFSSTGVGVIGCFTLFAHTFLYCGAGEIITGHCDEIYRATCDLDWYELDSVKIRSFMFFMMRLKEPSRITAGKVVPLKMATFCSLLKTSAGYISFLLAMQG